MFVASYLLWRDTGALLAGQFALHQLLLRFDGVLQLLVLGLQLIYKQEFKIGKETK